MSRQETATRTVDARDGARPLAGRWLHIARVGASHRHLADIAALGSVFGVAAIAYWWTRAPLYNPSSSVDPWLYTALFVNFDEVYAHFNTTYYAARLPWIVPGRLVYGILPVDAAYWVLHGVAFVGGVTALYFLVRRYLGVPGAVVGAATLALTPMYWNAQYWDYVDGVMITYLLAGLCFGLPSVLGFRRTASLAAAGFFFAAAVTTNLLALVFAVIYPIAYVFVQPASGLHRRIVMAFTDLLALLVGAAGLILVFGFYARAYGGEFLFFQPQIDVIRQGVVGTTKVGGYEWLRAELRLLAPPFLVVAAMPVLIAGRRLPQFRFAAGSVLGLAFLSTVIYGWEFLAGGAVLDYTYSFSAFCIPIALAIASTAALAFSLTPPHWSPHAAGAIVAVVAAGLALGLIYRNERLDWVGRPGGRTAATLMILAVLLIFGMLVARRFALGPIVALAAIGSVSFASHFAINNSHETFAYSVTAPENRNLYHAALDTVAFVERERREGDPLPAFWYRGANTDFTSIQSMYFYAYTAIDWKLPAVTTYTRQRLTLLNPRTIVMLCEMRGCSGGTASLRRAGYLYAEESAKRISHGRVDLWAVVLRAKQRQ